MALAAAIYIVFTVYFYLKPVVPAIEGGSDKFLHFVGFFAGGFLLLFFQEKNSARRLGKPSFISHCRTCHSRISSGSISQQAVRYSRYGFQLFGLDGSVVIFTFIVRLRTLSKG